MNNLLNLNAFPPRVRYSFFFLLGGWVWHFFFIYLVFIAGQQEPATQIIYQQLAIVAFLCYFLYQVKKWAWALCLLCNSLIVLLYGFFAALFWAQRPQLALLSLGVIGCFAAATYFLLSRQARDFYAPSSSDPATRSDNTSSGGAGR